MAPTASVGGTLQRTAPRVSNNPWEVGGVDMLALLRGFVGMAALGLALVFAFPRATTIASATIQLRALPSFGLGLTLLICTPVVASMMFLLGLLIGGWWISLMLMAVYGVLPVFGYLASAEWLGLTMLRLANSKAHMAWAMLLGLSILGVLSVVPALGGFIVLLATVFGLGALALTAWQMYQYPRQVQPVPTLMPAPVPLQAEA